MPQAKPKTAAHAIDLFWAIKRTADNQDGDVVELLVRLQALLEEARDEEGCNTQDLLAEMPMLVDAAKSVAYGSVAAAVGTNRFRLQVYNAVGIAPNNAVSKCAGLAG
jgi:hypothetical protein